MNAKNFSSLSASRPGLRHATVVLAAAMALTSPAFALAQSSAPQGETLAPAPARIDHATIRADHAAYQETQARIKALNDKGIRVDNYHLAKAQCWLDTSFHEYTRNDRGGYPQAALTESVKLISGLENGTDPGWETPLVNGAEKLRADLWAKYDSLRSLKGWACAAQATACAEVELVHAGNEIHDGGWRHANPYIQIAEDLTAKAELRAAQCAEPEYVAPVISEEKFDIAADALFKFDRGDLAGLLPEGRQSLDNLAARIGTVFQSVERIRLVGHTDRLGSDAYNQRLSEQRVWTIKQYLQDKGMTAAIQAEGVGESQPTGQTGQCIGERATAALKACLQPDRRVDVSVLGVKNASQ